MSHKENQENAELSIYEQSLEVARAKGGEARRNVARLSGDIRLFDRPDILITAEDGKRIVGIEHFRVDHHIGRGKKVESKSARFSSDAERFRRRHEDAARRGALEGEAYRGFGDLISRAIREQSSACVDEIRASLDAGLFGKNGRGHAFKLDAYRENITQIDANADIRLGFLIEIHTDLRQWFLNDGFKETRVSPGQFPISCEAYELLKKASAHVDWILLAFCPLYGDEVRDAAIIRCYNGMFETSAARQGIIQTPYLGLGKETPFGKQDRQGEVEFGAGNDSVDYLVENTSELMDPFELFNNAICGAAEALNLARKAKPFAATTPVQLTYDSVKDILKHKRSRVEPSDVLEILLKMDPSERNLRTEQWGKRWSIGNA
ncbi:hypothetical protein [Collinsella sp. AF20-14LB]|uniref:hypothetical protein n=1 Tax=Collinsella sp. AF20-14LB TaxID=2292221 RepID=UPI000E53C5A2|nr:hypothetical protein [Collinsella sp. AF20-14LB]RGS94062.1 hypothetical protein DWX63_01565 [Collinsella sp. AF20-14LB]